jgi:predicted tellurium resistance membrane protein TerC
MDYSLEIFTHPGTWISLLTLSFLEIVLGVDNIIFISLVANKLPQHKRKQARNIGLIAALGVRLVLLMFLSYIIGLTQPLFHLPIEEMLKEMNVITARESADISFKDLILIVGGFFLIYKSTSEIHAKVEGGQHEEIKTVKSVAFSAVILQIVLVDIVFSFDSILTAIGLTQHVTVMMAAVVISMLVMMQFSTAISSIINKYPTLQMLALSFLILIGFTLIMEGLDIHINKGFVYIAVLFSLIVEMINIRLRKKNMGHK